MQSSKENTHWIVTASCGVLLEAIPYSSRRTAARGAQRASLRDGVDRYVVEDCGDHWGLWDGYRLGYPLDAELLRREVRDLEAALPAEGFGNG